MTETPHDPLYRREAEALAAAVGASSVLGVWQSFVKMEEFGDDGRITLYDEDGDLQCSFRGVVPVSETLISLRVTAAIGEQAEMDMLTLAPRLAIAASASDTVTEDTNVDVLATDTTIAS